MDITFYSHELQDEFVTNLFGLEHKGVFLDVSCWHPIQGSNTYTLEKYLGWTGNCFDIIDAEQQWSWSNHRSAKFNHCNVASGKFVEILESIRSNTPVIDYASIDVDSSLTVVALDKIIKSGIELKVVTFEHEFYLYDNLYQKESEKILYNQGFIKLFSNVKLLTVNQTSPNLRNQTESFEDWWINPKHFSNDIIEVQSDSLYYHHCVNKLKKYSNLTYNGTHACSRAFPDEYSLHVLPGEKENTEKILDFVRSNNLNV